MLSSCKEIFGSWIYSTGTVLKQTLNCIDVKKFGSSGDYFIHGMPRETYLSCSSGEWSISAACSVYSSIEICSCCGGGWRSINAACSFIVPLKLAPLSCSSGWRSLNEACSFIVPLNLAPAVEVGGAGRAYTVFFSWLKLTVNLILVCIKYKNPYWTYITVPRK